MKITESELRQLIQESIQDAILKQEEKSKKESLVNNIVESILKEERWNYGRGVVGREDHFKNKAWHMVNSTAKKFESVIKGILIPPTDAREIKISLGGGSSFNFPCADGKIEDYVWILIPVKNLENNVTRNNWEKLITQLVQKLDNFGKGGEYYYDYDYNPKRNTPAGPYAYFRLKKEPIYVPRETQEFNGED